MSLEIEFLAFNKLLGQAKLLAVDETRPEERKVLSFEAQSEAQAREFVAKLNER